MTVCKGFDDLVDDSGSCMTISSQRLGSWRIQDGSKVIQLHEPDIWIGIVQPWEEVRNALHG